jgi:hypothetical protein
MLSASAIALSATPNFDTFDTFATAMNCTQPAGSAARLECLRGVPAQVIANYTNGPVGGQFDFGAFSTLVVDK